MPNQHTKRREQVYDLCVVKSTPINEVADVMKVSPKIIRSDIRAIQKTMAKELLEQGHESLLVTLLENRKIQSSRIHRYLQNDLADTARAKYESIIMEIDKQIEKLYSKLISVAVKVDNKLEDNLSQMTFSKFNEIIGLPIHPNKKLPCPITQAQMKLFEAVDPQKRSWVALNKARQCGFTEATLRILAYYSFSKYRGQKIAIVSGTRVETTLEIFSRLCNLFQNIAETVAVASSDTLTLKNGTSFHVIPASKNAINGWSSFSAFLLDESAFWNLEEDQVILNSFLPIARTNSSDIFMISNPNGARGFFYSITDAKSPSWNKLEINIHEGGKELYSVAQIQEMIDSSDEDPNSSYLCKFVGGRDSIFGELTEDDLSSIYEAVPFD